MLVLPTQLVPSPQDKQSSWQEMLSLQTPNCKWGPQAIHVSAQPVSNWGRGVFPCPPQGWWFTRMAHSTQGSAWLIISFIIKNTDYDQPNEETHQASLGWEGPECQAPMWNSPGRIRIHHPPGTLTGSPTRKLHWASVSSVFIGVSLQRDYW